jgi:hypothetical protein
VGTRAISPRFCLAAVALALVALVSIGRAGADPLVSPPVVVAGHNQFFTLVAEPDVRSSLLASVELYPPPDFTVKSFVDAPGWHLDWTIQSKATIVQKAIWTREPQKGATSEQLEEQSSQDASFSFVADPTLAKTYSFEVRETYADGSVLEFRTANSVAFPPSPKGAKKLAPPTLLAEAAAAGNGGGGSGSSTLAVIALIVGGLGLAVGAFALLTRRRPA